MSRLYLNCGLCGRQQADGILSRGYWGHLELGGGNALRACPACKEQHSDWEARLRAGDSSNSLGVAPLPQTGASYS